MFWISLIPTLKRSKWVFFSASQSASEEQKPLTVKCIHRKPQVLYSEHQKDYSSVTDPLHVICYTTRLVETGWQKV